jgi:DNA repair exonuclease SbcCD ATPase subunit
MCRELWSLKLEINAVKIQNFLSFGSVESVIPFNRGVNIVLGKDLSTGRSNGAGKSSFLESIPFALFGQTHKEIKKEQLINWKSRKGCKVELDFQIGNTPYKVIRGIKPDTFEIYEHTTMIEQPAHKRDYQRILDEIIGLNFNTFVSLIHSNINSSNKILSMKTQEKRKFMEDVFGLDVYSKLIEKSNEKMRKSKENLGEVVMMIGNNQHTIANTKSQNREINDKLKKIGSSRIEFRDAEEELNKLIDKNPDVEEKLKELDQKIFDQQDIISDIRTQGLKIENKVKLVNRWVRDIQNSLTQVAESEKTEAAYFKFIKEEGDIHTIVEKIDGIKIEIAKYESDLEVKLTKSRGIDLELAGLEAVKDFKCPKCGYSGVDNKADITAIKKKLSRATKDWQKTKDKVSEFKGKKGDLEQKRDWLLKMQEKLRTDVDPEKLRKDQARYNKTVYKLYAIHDDTKEMLSMAELTTKLLSETRETLRLKKLKIDNQKNKIEALKTKIGLEEKTRKEFQAIIKTNQKKVKDIEKENSELARKRDNIQVLLDYFDVIKEICKDENIKQYAISSIMPYLNKQTNLYLSEVGYGFYAVIDKWLKAEIKGPGVTKASYGSLSGGEARGIDLAIQFALLDIARIQAGQWPDILIMDEILDSSVDSKGISKLVEIIRAKQAQENNKIFVISHREEIGDEFEADFQYFVTKDRYSKVEVV